MNPVRESLVIRHSAAVRTGALGLIPPPSTAKGGERQTEGEKRQPKRTDGRRLTMSFSHPLGALANIPVVVHGSQWSPHNPLDRSVIANTPHLSCRPRTEISRPPAKISVDHGSGSSSSNLPRHCLDRLERQQRRGVGCRASSCAHDPCRGPQFAPVASLLVASCRSSSFAQSLAQPDAARRKLPLRTAYLQLSSSIGEACGSL
jgi:hypothetical protein